jgi:hypothetical protein
MSEARVLKKELKKNEIVQVCLFICGAIIMLAIPFRPLSFKVFYIQAT